VKRWYNYPKYLAEEPCRYCPHNAKFHIKVKNFGMDNQMAQFADCTCHKCPGYAPVDNLKYLEMKSDEQ
jgi:hypothetical protein